MRRMLAVSAGLVMFASCLAAANAAPKDTPKGLQNSKKVMQRNVERYKAVEGAKKRAHAQKEARIKKQGAAPNEEK